MSLARSLWVRLMSTGSEGVSNGINHLPGRVGFDFNAVAAGDGQDDEQFKPTDIVFLAGDLDRNDVTVIEQPLKRLIGVELGVTLSGIGEFYPAQQPQARANAVIGDGWVRIMLIARVTYTLTDSGMITKKPTPIDAMTPQVIAQYRDARTAKVRANREIALLSTMFTFAREWGLTDKANPCFGLRRNKETPRDFYAGDIIWNAVYEQAGQDLKDAMDLAYLTGQRPADVLKASTTDLNHGFLMVGQGKTEKRLRIRLYDGDTETDLCIFINGLLDRRAQAGVKTSILITTRLD